MKVLVTGSAGFIGFYVAKRFLERGDEVVGFDNVNAYYDTTLKEGRLSLLEETSRRLSVPYQTIRADLTDRNAVESCFKDHQFDRVVHLAAQAGVRHSLTHPRDYIQSNVVGFINILEACRHANTPHLTYASSSSVYGANTRMPFSEHQIADHPLQLYAATKRSNELMAHSYSHIFGLPTTGLRFFTVYGPWGRPDMALFMFTKNILEGKPIKVFNNGNHTRDFTFVEDIAEGVVRASDTISQPNPEWDGNDPDPASSSAPFKIYNIGNSSPVRLGDYIDAIESTLGKQAIRDLLPLQPGDVPDTYADISRLTRDLGYKPTVPVSEGVRRFVEWYLDFYGKR
jgi:UDP-glucuronate 4-epimerase